MLNRFPLYSTAWIWIWGLFVIIFIRALNIAYQGSTTLLEWTFFVLSTPVNITLLVDSTGTMFASTVIFISANVLIFSTVYIEDEKFKDRFTLLVLLFVLSINLLIFIPHFIVLLLGWDGLGIVSFVLVIYYQNPKSLAAGIITALTNRVGDVLLLVCIALTLNQGHWLIINMWDSRASIIQIMFIIFAAITKRAQIPFSRWLPAAIAAPTPVSALVHSSTLVTAGVFLLIRFYNFLHTFYMFNVTLLVVAVTTIFIAGARATTECDAKKIIALSTLRQLGIIITRLGFNLPHLAFFHIITHALFKALLFVCAGSFIHSHLHTQDLRWMGNITIQMPVATRCITLANLALCGFPFIAGFYSKDIIIEAAISSPNNIFILIVCIIRLGFTAFYSIRFSITTMWGPSLIAPYSVIKENKNVIYPILLLSLISISMGASISWISPIRSSIYLVPFYIKVMPLLIVTIGLILGWLITNTSNNTSYIAHFNMSHIASCGIWFLVPLSSQFILQWPLQSAHIITKFIDQGWLEQISGLNTQNLLIKTNNIVINSSPKLPSIYALTSALIFLAIIYLN